MAGQGNPGPMQHGVQPCWACGTCVHVPVISGQAVPLFKCGWCKALNSLSVSPALLAQPPGGAGEAPAAQSPALQLAAPRQPAPPLAARVGGGLMLLIVLALVGFVGVVGTSLLLPGAFGPWALLLAHYPWTGFVLFNILYNYAACVLTHPGPAQLAVQEAVGGDGRIPQGALDDYSLCERCRYYKPPAAHHCRSCGTCVVGLDHHCWYLGNQCVGSGNLRHFLRFLAWLVVGVGYALAAAAAMGWRERGALWRHTQHAWQVSARFSTAWRLVSYSLRWALAAPFWMALWAVAAGVSAMTLLLVGLLLHRQLVLLARGQTYIDVLKYQRQLYGGGSGSGGAAAAGVAGAPLPASGGAALQQQHQGTVAGASSAPPEARPPAAAAAAACSRPPLGVPRAWWGSALGRSLRGVYGEGHPLAWLLPPGTGGGGGAGSKKQS